MLAYKRLASAAIVSSRFCSSSPASLFTATTVLCDRLPHQAPLPTRTYTTSRRSSTKMMSENSTLPAPTVGTSEVLSHAVNSPNSTYRILYFNLHGRGELARNLLAYGGSKWEEIPVVSDNSPSTDPKRHDGSNFIV